MMKKGLLQVLSIAMLMATQAASAQGFFQDIGDSGPQRDQRVMSQLITAASAAPKTSKSKDGREWELGITGIRGGNGSKKPLGQYLVKPEMEFRSDYKNEATETMCQFAYDLHQFTVAKGRDWATMQRNSDLDYVPYEKQKEFASFWWLRHKEGFKHMSGIAKDWFLNDALIDGTNLYNWVYAQENGSADYTAWKDIAISSLMKKKP